jgi:hypothetical protein
MEIALKVYPIPEYPIPIVASVERQIIRCRCEVNIWHEVVLLHKVRHIDIIVTLSYELFKGDLPSR